MLESSNEAAGVLWVGFTHDSHNVEKGLGKRSAEWGCQSQGWWSISLVTSQRYTRWTASNRRRRFLRGAREEDNPCCILSLITTLSFSESRNIAQYLYLFYFSHFCGSVTCEGNEWRFRWTFTSWLSCIYFAVSVVKVIRMNWCHISSFGTFSTIVLTNFIHIWILAMSMSKKIYENNKGTLH